MIKNFFYGLFSLLLLLPVQAAEPKAHSLEQLKQMYTPAERQVLERYRRDFNQVYTLGDWAELYRLAVSQRQVLAGPLSRAQEAWLTDPNPQAQPDFSWAEVFFPGMNLAYVAEGTQLELFVNYQDFAALARKTPSPEDDAFMRLMIKAQGPSFSYYPKWFVQTWDYGGCSLAGKGIHQEVLKEMQNVLKLGPTFVPEIQDLKQDLLKDLTEGRFFCQPKAAVRQEIKGLVGNPLLDASEEQSLKKRLSELDQNATLEFNCLDPKSTCSFG